MLLAEAAMDVIGSDEGFRRAVPHQEGGLPRHGSMAATDAQTIRFEPMITRSYQQTGAYLRYLGILETAPSVQYHSCPGTRARSNNITSLDRKVLGHLPNAIPYRFHPSLRREAKFLSYT
jgi:hypothetical protein